MGSLSLLSALSRVAINLLDKPTNAKESSPSSAISDMNARSLLEMSSLAEVEVITVVDSSLVVHESTTDILRFVNSLYSSWYISSSSIVTDTGRIKTSALLAKLNPTKSPGVAITNSILSVAEKAIGGAVLKGVANAGDNLLTGWGTESYDVGEIDVTPKAEPLPMFLPRTVDVSMEASVGGFRQGNDLNTIANLSVGQSVVLSISDGDASKDVVVNIRLAVAPVSGNILKTILTWADKDLRLKTRFAAFRAGELRFWRDVVLMRDIFTERQRVLMNDKSNLLRLLLGRQRDSMINSVLTAQPDIGNMSSVLVISQDTLDRLEETVLEGPLADFSYRQRIMNNTGLILIVVVDPISELVTIYRHTTALKTEASIRQLKAAGKGGSDIAELIKLMNQNKMPNY